MAEEINEALLAEEEEDQELRPQGLKALNAERLQRRKLQEELASLRAKYSSIDIEEINRLKQDAEKREQQELEEKAQYAAALRVKEEKYQAELISAKAEGQKIQSRLEASITEQAVIDAFLAAGGRRDDSPKAYIQLLLPAIAGQLKVVGDEVVIIDGQGDIKFNPATAAPYTLADLMGECRKKGATALFFEPEDKASGAGATANGRRIGGDKMKELESMPRAARLAWARENGLV
jgi:antitoxin component of MazEF toxin-antitoxin module